MRFVAFFIFALSFTVLAFDSAEEFEGRYQVGDTTCTVKPIKMAFEVWWTKREKAMVFFYEIDSSFGNYTYVSEEKPGGFDRFVFSGEHLITGVFIRSDGAQYPLEKINSN